MTNKFNLIEIIPSKEDMSAVIIGIFWKNKDIKIFGPTDTVINFKSFIKKKGKNKKKIITFYTQELDFIITTLIKINESEIEEIRYFLTKNSIYYIKIKIADTWVLIKNLEKFYPKLLKEEEENWKNKYYPGTKEKCVSIGNYVISKEKKEEQIKLLEILRPKWIENITPTKDFFKNNEEQWLRPEEEIPEKIKAKLEKSKKIMKELDFILSQINSSWYYSYSLSSVSIQTFYKSYNNFAIKIETSAEWDEKLRPSYFGGRCEVFGNPNTELERIYHFDFENMYGNIMQNDFPTGELRFVKNITNLEFPGFYFVTVNSSEMKIPILPHKSNIEKEENIWDESWKKEMLFTNGKFEGLYFYEELELFIKEGGKILKFHYAYIYSEKSKPIFREYAKELINLRKGVNSWVWKQLLVSFYGRMGMPPQKNENIIGVAEKYENIIKNRNIIQEVWFDNIFIAQVTSDKIKEKVESNVGYAAIITSKARIKLWKNMKAIKEEKGRILYCDTDSIFAAFLKDKRVLNKKTGDIFWDEKIKNIELEDAVFGGTRNYSIKTKDSWETRISGLPRNSINFEDYKKNFYLSWKKEYKAEVIRSKVFKTEKWNTLVTTSLKNYKKRCFSADKKHTKPLILANGQYNEDPSTKWS